MIFKPNVTGKKKDHMRNAIAHMINEADAISVYTDVSYVELVPKDGETYKSFALTGEGIFFVKLMKNGKRFIPETEVDERAKNEG